jgi:hypothetical protein
MSSAERRLSAWLTATGVAYAFGAADYLARPKAATRSLSKSGGERLDDEEPGLYHSLAVAYMATIAGLSFSAARSPAERADLIPPLLVAKIASSGALIYRYQQTRRRGYAIAAALDAALFGITAGLYSNIDR